MEMVRSVIAFTVNPTGITGPKFHFKVSEGSGGAATRRESAAARRSGFQDAFERPVECEDDDTGKGGETSEHQEEARLVHDAPEAAEPTGEEIAGEARRQPQAHRHRE